jgi:hypothetical protein
MFIISIRQLLESWRSVLFHTTKNDHVGVLKTSTLV